MFIMKANSKRLSRAARKTERLRKERTSQILKVIAGVAVLAVVLFLVLARTGQQGKSAGTIQGVQAFPNQERGHTDGPVKYDQIPPVGGVHSAAWQNCGVYTQPVPNENAVHSLEHGAVWITYQPGLPQDELKKLQELTRQSGYRLLSPYPDLPSPIVLSAWGYQLRVDKADDPRIQQFLKKYEQNPQGPEPGASCSGGVGQPG